MLRQYKQPSLLFFSMLLFFGYAQSAEEINARKDLPQERKKTNEMLEIAKFIGVSEGAFLGYSCLHNLVNMTVSHDAMREIATQMYGRVPKNLDGHPIRMACQLGIHGTWWMGLIASIPIYATARFGDKPKMELTDVAIPASVGIGFTAGVSLATGLISAALGADRKDIANYAQSMAYLAGTLAIVGVCVNNWNERKEMKNEELRKIFS